MISIFIVHPHIPHLQMINPFLNLFIF